MKESIAGILKKEGYIEDFAVEGKVPKTHQAEAEVSGQEERDRRLEARQHARLAPVCRLDRNPARARWSGCGGFSTSRRYHDRHRGPQENLGGELLCYVW